MELKTGTQPHKFTLFPTEIDSVEKHCRAETFLETYTFMGKQEKHFIHHIHESVNELLCLEAEH